jgi:hypothetical protein
MGIFDLFKKKKVELTEEQLKWNKMWELWTEEKVETPYAELMTYQSEINNGGHSQYFTNVENTGNLQEELSILQTIISKKLYDNLQKAYQAYLFLEKEDDETAEVTMKQYDDVFYESEDEINRILQEYANKIKL